MGLEPRWLPAKIVIVMAMHPTKAMRSMAVHAAATKMGWHGNYHYCRKELAANDTLFYQPKGTRTWALTAVGLTLQAAVLRDIRAILGVHDVRVLTSAAVQYALNGENHLVCTACGAAQGTPHTPTCTATHIEGLDANVTKR